MKHRAGILLLIMLLITAGMRTLAYDDSDTVNCQLNLTPTVANLKTAQRAIDKHDMDTALSSVSEARNTLQLLEAKCSDYAPQDAGNSRPNPVPFGQRQHAEIGTNFSGSIQLIEYLDDAKIYVKKANSHNKPAPEGTRYIVFRLKYSCEKMASDSCDFTPVQFSTVGDKGLVYNYDSNRRYDMLIRNIANDAELFGGAEIEVDIAFIVDATDSNFVLFTDYPDSRTFFAGK